MSIYSNTKDPSMEELLEDLRNFCVNYKEAAYDDFIDLNRKEAIERNTKIVTCDRCGVSGGETNMMRWHFSNCKTVLRECQHCGKKIPRQGIKDSLYKHKKYCNMSCYNETKKGKCPIIMTSDVKEKLRNSALLQSKERGDRAKKNKLWLHSPRHKNVIT